MPMEPVSKRPAPGMFAVAAAFGSALVAGLLVRDLSGSTIVRIATPIVAALLGIVIAFKVAEARARRR